MKHWLLVLSLPVLAALCIPAAAQQGDVLSKMPRDANGCVTALKEKTGKCFSYKDGKLFVDGKPAQAVIGTTRDLDAKRTPLPAAPQGVHRIDAAIPVKQLDSRDNLLPQLFVFDKKTGREADIATLPKELAAYLNDGHLTRWKRTESGKSPLQQAIGRGRMPDGRSVEDVLRNSKARHVLVQWWAEWCTGCLLEAKELGALMTKTPMPDVAWVTIENDIAKSPTQGAKK